MDQQAGKLTNNMPDISAMMDDLGRNAREAASELALCPGSRRNQALQAAANSIRDSRDSILAANQVDMIAAENAA